MRLRIFCSAFGLSGEEHGISGEVLLLDNRHICGFHLGVPACVVYEDADLLVVNKPAGLNTHAPYPYAVEGLYDWLRNREPRWRDLAIIHRLDKETSGLIVFGKTARANRSLTQQFKNRTVRKTYVLLTASQTSTEQFTIKSSIVRVGDKYVSRPLHAGANIAETRFKIQSPKSKSRETGNKEAPAKESPFRAIWSQELPPGCQLLTAEPITGRTHQIRVHAADAGVPIFGDALYGGQPAPRVCLHAAKITFSHPINGREISFQCPADFHTDTPLALRRALIDRELTDAYRIIHGASDGFPGWYVDRLGEFLLSQGEQDLNSRQMEKLDQFVHNFNGRAIYHKKLRRELQRARPLETAPKLLRGEAVAKEFVVRENGVRFQVSFEEGYSFGLFPDQRDNRRRLLTGYVAPHFSLSPLASASVLFGSKEEKVEDKGIKQEKPHGAPRLLNAFAYTCGFSVCAAKAGWHTTNLDLSKKYLEWGKRNFRLNDLETVEHEFIYGDVFDWFGRLAKKQRKFDLILLDPPTFSQSKESGIFRAERDYAKLVRSALPLLRTAGVLLASTNAASWPPEDFLACVIHAIGQSGRKVVQQHYAPQPPDFPASRAQPPYLKTLWLRVSE